VLYIYVGQGHDLLLDFKAYKEKLLQEQLILNDATNKGRTVMIVLHARVLGNIVEQLLTVFLVY